MKGTKLARNFWEIIISFHGARSNRLREIAMSEKRMSLIGFILCLCLAAAFTPAVAQTGTAAIWEEGQQAALTAAKSGDNILAVPTTPGTNYRTFSGTRFQPTSSALTYAALSGAIYATAIPAGGFSFSLEMDLPQGAKITEVVFFVVDNDASNISLSLVSYDPEANDSITLKSAFSSGASPTLQTIIIPVDPPIQVENTTTSYRLRVAPGVAATSQLLRGARIGYTASPLFLPTILKTP
jgi:hypothetical protein